MGKVLDKLKAFMYDKKKDRLGGMDVDRDKILQTIEQVGQIIYGKEEEIREVMLAFMADGHILLEDIPGVGKTTMALAFSKSMGLDYRRIQFTPDVLPSDLTGFSLYRRDQEAFVYQPGVVFCNLLLTDEINRTSPKTQSALLEVMEERKVTVEGVTRPVPSPFLVIATQNPLGSAGTQSLPEAQIDRFMVSLSIGYPDYKSELQMAMGIGYQEKLDDLSAILDQNTLLRIQKEICDIYIRKNVYEYMVRLVRATREHPYLRHGGSPRATIALVRLARASAWLKGRTFVVPADVAEQFPYIIRHRIFLNDQARMESADKEQVIRDILLSVKRPVLGERRR